MTDINQTTPFCIIYDRFLSKITDDMYLELTKEDTYRDLRDILENSIGNFKFPRFPLYNYQLVDNLPLTANGVPNNGFFESRLTREEVDIVSDLMALEWIRRQILSVENTRMKYSGSDFKFTSQANHLDKLMKLFTMFDSKNKQKQGLYKRRKIEPNGTVKSNWGKLSGGALKNGR